MHLFERKLGIVHWKLQMLGKLLNKIIFFTITLTKAEKQPQKYKEQVVGNGYGRDFHVGWICDFATL